MHTHHYINRISFIILCLACFIPGCTKDREAVFLPKLEGGLASLGRRPANDAFIIHNELYAQAMELEKNGEARRLNLNRVIGMLALRRAMLAEILGKSDLVQKNIDDALERFDRGGILSKNLPKSQQDKLFEQFVSTVLELEKPQWSESLYQIWIRKGFITKPSQ